MEEEHDLKVEEDLIQEKCQEAEAISNSIASKAASSGLVIFEIKHEKI